MEQSWIWIAILIGFVVVSLASAFAERSLAISKTHGFSRVTAVLYMGLGGVAFVLFLGEAVRGEFYKRIIEIIEKPSETRTWNFDFLVSTAWADTSGAAAGSNPALTATLITLVFYAILIAFGGALFVLLFWQDKAENKRALDAADNIVKMFGGFLIGVGSAFFGIR